MKNKNMTEPLEQLLGGQAVKDLKGRSFGIKPETKYDPNSDSIREEFVKRASDLFDIEDYYKRLDKNQNDLGALDDIINIATKYMPGDRDENVRILKNPHNALRQAQVLTDSGYLSMAKFVENNRDEILKSLNEKQLFSLINNTPLYPTGNQEHDRVSYIINKLNQMRKAGQEQGEAGIGSVIQEELKELIEYVPEEQKLFIQECPEMINSLTRGLIGKVQKAHSALFKKEDKSLDKEAMIKHLEDNYKVVEDVMDNGNMSDNEKLSLWDKNLKMQYVEIARELFGPEKKKYKKDKDEDKENRKDKAKRLGLQT